MASGEIELIRINLIKLADVHQKRFILEQAI